MTAQAAEQLGLSQTLHRDGTVVCRREADLRFFAVGTGEYDELSRECYLCDPDDYGDSSDSLSQSPVLCSVRATEVTRTSASRCAEKAAKRGNPV